MVQIFTRNSVLSIIWLSYVERVWGQTWSSAVIGSGFFLLQLGINIISVFTYNRQLMYSKEPFGLAEH